MRDTITHQQAIGTPVDAGCPKLHALPDNSRRVEAERKPRGFRDNRIQLTMIQLGKRWRQSPNEIKKLKAAGVVSTLAGLYDLKVIEGLEAIGFTNSQTTTNH